MAQHAKPIRVGRTGWALPATSDADFPQSGRHLERYARRFRTVEISSSFYRHYLPRTYARWAATVPADFHFAVKLPRAVTHDARLGERLGPLLVQLLPSLAFDAARAAAIACEPRHPSWFTDAADALLAEARIARVAADPALMPAAACPGGWTGLAYHRLHGSPIIYRSPYPALALDADAATLLDEAVAAPVWCFFDNWDYPDATDTCRTQGGVSMSRTHRPSPPECRGGAPRAEQ
jgi:uncharacterized protein YecE (DUF72 family)